MTLNATVLKISIHRKTAVELESFLKTSLEITYPTDNAKSQKACVAKMKNPTSLRLGDTCIEGIRITISVLSSRRTREAKECAKNGVYSEALT
jgi:hypothetical protein